MIAESLTFEDCMVETQALRDRLALNDLLEPYLWSALGLFAHVIPDGDILRARFNGQSANIAFNCFNHRQPLFYAGPGLAASKILSGKAPEDSSRIPRCAARNSERSEARATPLAVFSTV